jgi:hypothetical protein
MLASWTFCLALFAQEQELPVGEETVKPLKYPKTFFGFDYGMKRKFHGFNDQSLRLELPESYKGNLGLEVGLYKYLNAGSIISFDVHRENELLPINLSLSFYAKPQIPLGERFAIFSRLSGGLSLDLIGMANYLAKSSIGTKFASIYGGSSFYSLLPYGVTGYASLGLEYFFLSRVGVSIEGGIRTVIIRAEKSDKILNAFGDDQAKAQYVKAPKNFDYMTYDFPITVNLSFIF